MPAINETIREQPARPVGPFDDLDVRVEAALIGHPSVADCAVLLREGPAGAELMGYVVPIGPYNAERLLETVRASVCDLAMPIGFIAVSSIPLRADGSVNSEMLTAIPLADILTTAQCQESVRQLPPGTRVEVWENQQPTRLLHISDLLPGWRGGSTPDGEPVVIHRTHAREDSAIPALSCGEPLHEDPAAPATLQEALRRAATEFPNHGVIYVHPDGTDSFQSYPALLETAERVLGGLRQLGLKVSDPVLFQLEHASDFIAAFWGCVLGGFIPVPVSIAPAYDQVNATVAKLHNAWQMLDRPVILASNSLVEPVRGIANLLPADGLRVLSITDLMNRPRDGGWHASEPDDLAILLLTSGSTGAPKAVMQSHRALLSRSAASRSMNHFTPQDISVNWLPLDHVGGIVMFHLHDVFVMCTQVHARTHDVLADPLKWLDWLDRYRATATWAPNFAFGLVNAQMEEVARRHWDLTRVRFILNGGEAIVSQTARRFLSILEPHGLRDTAMHPSWGMSETCSGVTFIHDFSLTRTSDDDLFVEVGSPVPGFAMRIVDGANQVQYEGTVGRLQVKGPSVLNGYFHNPQANRDCFTEDGWFITGDLGIISNGRLTITGREKDIIIINGVNYHGHEIEKVVEEVPGIDASFTSAFAIRERGIDTDQLVICFSPSGRAWHGNVEMAAVLRQVRSRVVASIGVNPTYLIPVNRETIPKTSIGKIQRSDLARRMQTGEFDNILKRVDLLLETARTIPDWFYRKTWRRRQTVQSGTLLTGRCLIFSDAAGTGEMLAREVILRGSNCIMVRRGPALTQIGGGLYTIDPSDPSQYTSLLEALPVEDGPINTVVHLWACDTAPEPESGEALDLALNSGVLSVLHLAQALQKVPIGQTTTRLLVVARGVQSATAAISPAHAMVSGILKTVQQELPGLACRIVRLEDTPGTEDAKHLASELVALPYDTDVAYRSGDRWVPRLVNAEMGSNQKIPSPFVDGGFYCLTGGLGAIGSEIARQLVKDYHARLLLIGRTPIEFASAERRNTLAELQSLGGDVRYQAVDVCDTMAMEQAVAAAEVEWRVTLAGVIHVAGTFREGLIAEENRDDFRSALGPKVQGTRAVLQLLRQRPDAFLIGFSSINGFFGGFASGAYAAANAFLDAAIEQEHAKGRRAISLAWSLWNEVGMSRGYSMKELSRAQGYLPVSRTQGVRSFLAAVQSKEPVVFIGLDSGGPQVRRRLDAAASPLYKLVIITTEQARADAQRVASNLRNDRFGSPIALDVVVQDTATSDIATSSAAPAGQSATDLERDIGRIWADVLGNEVDLDGNLFDLGGTSLLVAQIYQKLHTRMGDKVRMTDLFQFPTVRSLCRHLSGGTDFAANQLKADEERGKNSREQLRRRRGSAGA